MVEGFISVCPKFAKHQKYGEKHNNEKLLENSSKGGKWFVQTLIEYGGSQKGTY